MANPLFIAHRVMELTPVGKRIQSGHAVYTIQARRLDGKSAPLETVEEMRQLGMEAIREVDGDYGCPGGSKGAILFVSRR